MNNESTTPSLPSDFELTRVARQAALRAYCPYSHFRVGASVLAQDGTIFSGCNIENSSYGLTICAERVAIFNAIAAGHNQVIRMALSLPEADHQLLGTLMPCGACRQVLSEFAQPSTIIIVDQLGEFRLDSLLPNPFRI